MFRSVIVLAALACYAFAYTLSLNFPDEEIDKPPEEKIISHVNVLIGRVRKSRNIVPSNEQKPVSGNIVISNLGFPVGQPRRYPETVPSNDHVPVGMKPQIIISNDGFSDGRHKITINRVPSNDYKSSTSSPRTYVSHVSTSSRTFPFTPSPPKSPHRVDQNEDAVSSLDTPTTTGAKIPTSTEETPLVDRRWFIEFLRIAGVSVGLGLVALCIWCFYNWLMARRLRRQERIHQENIRGQNQQPSEETIPLQDPRV